MGIRSNKMVSYELQFHKIKLKITKNKNIIILNLDL